MAAGSSQIFDNSSVQKGQSIKDNLASAIITDAQIVLDRGSVTAFRRQSTNIVQQNYKGCFKEESLRVRRGCILREHHSLFATTRIKLITDSDRSDHLFGTYCCMHLGAETLKSLLKNFDAYLEKNIDLDRCTNRFVYDVKKFSLPL